VGDPRAGARVVDELAGAHDSGTRLHATEDV